MAGGFFFHHVMFFRESSFILNAPAMKRLLGSLFVIAGVLCVGLLPTYASEPNAQLPVAMLATSSEQYASEQMLIITSLDLLADPLFQSFFTSYVHPPSPFAVLLPPTVGTRDPNTTPDPPNPPMGTNESNAQSGGTDSIRENSHGSELGSGGNVTPAPGPKTLQLVELYPHTEGQDKTNEYIAIKNTGGTSISLAGWSLKDASGKTYIFKEGTIAPGETKKLGPEQTGIALNNDKDSVALYAPDQQLIDSVSYEKTKKGDTFSRQGDTWRWSSDVSASQPTVDAKLPLEQSNSTSTNTSEPTPPVTQTKNSQNKSTLVTAKSLSIANAKEAADETRVELTAIVSVPPGILGKQFFYVQDDSGGIQVYKHDADFPFMESGTQIHLSGTMSTSGKERRVKISKDDILKITGTEVMPDPVVTKIDQLATQYMGTLAKLTGTLSSVGSDRFELEDQGNTVEIDIASYTNIDTSLFKPGMKIEATGIVRPSGDTVKLSPRSQNDLVVLQEETPLATGTVDSGKTQEQQKNQILGTAIAAATAGAVIFWVVKQHLQKKHHTYVSPTLNPGAETVT